MNFDRNCLRLYAVTDRAWVGRQTLCQQVEAALQGGATCVQLREKQLDKAAFLAEARQIAALCRRYGAPFIVNDDLDIALACGADGVHVGQDDLSAAEVRRRGYATDNMEAEIGIGYVGAKYEQYECVRCGTLLDEGISHNFAVTKLALSVVFMIF